MPENEKVLQELLSVAQEQLRWQRAAVQPQIRQTLEVTLTSTKLRRAFEMCDGQTPSNEIAAAVGVTPPALSNWTRTWRDLGIAYKQDGKIKHLTSLPALGLPVELED